MGVAEAKRVGVVVPTELPVFGRAWGTFQPHFPDAIARNILAQRRPSDVIPYVAEKQSTRVEIGWLVTPSMNEVFRTVMDSPEMNAVNAVMCTSYMRTKYKGDFPGVVKSTAWDLETMDRATLLGFLRRLEDAEALSTANKEYYEEQSRELERMYHGPNKDFYNGGGHELLVDTAHRQSAGRNGMTKWTNASNHYRAEIIKLQTGGMEPLTLDELNELIADLVDRELAASTAQEREMVGAGRRRSLGSILSKRQR